MTDEQPKTTDFGTLASELQREIDAQERAIYSARAIQEARDPKNVGRMAEADTHGLVHGWCGDTMEVYLRLEGERIERATFMTDGCGATLACGSMLTQMVTGMSLTEAEAVRPEDLLEALDGLPEENQHCAQLAVSTLQSAILNWGAERQD
jgi:nitrogen fixation NifU-like protein